MLIWVWAWEEILIMGNFKMSWYKEAKKEKYDDFNYGGSIRILWRNIVKKEQDRVNIHFDLENDDSYDIKTRDLEYKNKNGDIFRVKARISWAGGDWECPICYFKCQFQERSYFERDNSWGQWGDRLKCIIIPEKSNSNLEKCKKGLGAKGSDYGVGSKDINEKELWDEMLKMAEKRVKGYYDEYKRDDGEMDIGFDNTGCVSDLTDIM